MTAFRSLSELWNNIAGPDDQTQFEQAFDRLLDGLTDEQLDQIGRLIELLKSGRPADQAAPHAGASAKPARARPH